MKANLKSQRQIYRQNQYVGNYHTFYNTKAKSLTSLGFKNKCCPFINIDNNFVIHYEMFCYNTDGMNIDNNFVIHYDMFCYSTDGMNFK